MSTTEHFFTKVACTVSDMQIVVQGKQWNLGTFADPVSAAICYDREATKAYGAAAVLNLPPGCNSRPMSAGTVGQPPLLPGDGDFREKEPLALPPGSLPPGSPPAGRADGNPVPYSGPLEVRLSSSPSSFVHVLRRVCTTDTASACYVSMFEALGTSCAWIVDWT
jgi:hypothetical protein